MGLLDDLRILPNRSRRIRETLTDLRRTAPIWATMMSQSLQYGTPLSQARCAIADELVARPIICWKKEPLQVGRCVFDLSDGVVHASSHVRHFGRQSAICASRARSSIKYDRAMSTDEPKHG